MKKKHLGFFLLIIVSVTLLFGVILGPPFLLSKKVYRDWAVRQTRPVCNGISMRIEGTYILPGSDYRLLRVWSRWLGGNLKDHYDLRAAIRTTAEFRETPEMPYWYTPVVCVGPNGETKKEAWSLWEFHAPKGSPEHVWMRIYFRPQKSHEKEQWVDFDFPYFQAEDSTSPNDPLNWSQLLN